MPKRKKFKLRAFKKRLAKKTKKVKKQGAGRAKNRNQYKWWRKSVYIKDGYTCQKCGAKEKLNAHHIRPWSLFPLDRYSVVNGVTLCETCHKWVHEPGRKSKYLDLGKYDE